MERFSDELELDEYRPGNDYNDEHTEPLEGGAQGWVGTVIMTLLLGSIYLK